MLSSHDPPILLAKVDANAEENKELASQFDVKGFPTIKILRNGGKDAQEYKGPREADGIVTYLKKQVGPASSEIKTIEEANERITGNNVFIVSLPFVLLLIMGELWSLIIIYISIRLDYSQIFQARNIRISQF